MKTLKANLSEKSLDALINALEAYKEQFKSLEQQFLEQLAVVVKTELERVYNTAKITVTYEPFQEGNIHGVNVIANGDAIGFIEFGAGVYAGENSIHKDNAPFDVYPGSWSDFHEAQTYRKWVEGGRKGEYQYNRHPKNAFPQAYAILRNSVHHTAEEIFGRGFR